MTNSRIRATLLASLVAVASLGIAACGDDDEGGNSGSDTEVAEQIAPQFEDQEAVSVKAPVYAGDPDATGEPGEDLLADLPTLQRRDATPEIPTIRGSSGQSVAQWLQAVGDDVQQFWQSLFNAQGIEYQAANHVLYEADPVNSGCGAVSNDAGPLYCPTDTTVYLPVPWFGDAVEQTNDAAMAIVVAHEVGHHVQNVANLYEGKRSIDIELQADCLGGTWTASLGSRDLIEPGDVEEALGLSHALGDPEGVRDDDPQAHGSGEKRVAAFQAGLNGGPGACEDLSSIAGGGGGGAPGGGDTGGGSLGG